MLLVTDILADATEAILLMCSAALFCILYMVEYWHWYSTLIWLIKSVLKAHAEQLKLPQIDSLTICLLEHPIYIFSTIQTPKFSTLCLRAFKKTCFILVLITHQAFI